jgi:SAM-dependent methyltransferase
MHPDAMRWNARYRQEREYFLDREPYQLVRLHAGLLPDRGLVLDVAAGVVPLGLFMVKYGLEVVALDISMEALQAAQERFRSHGQSLACAVLDLADPWLPSAHFDVVLNFYYLSRPLLARYKSALKPGGLLFCEILLWDERPGSNPQNYLRPGELEESFADWKTLFYDEAWKIGRKKTMEPRKIVQLIAQRPSERERSN